MISSKQQIVNSKLQLAIAVANNTEHMANGNGNVVSLSFPLGQHAGLVAVGSGWAPAKSLDSEV